MHMIVTSANYYNQNTWTNHYNSQVSRWTAYTGELDAADNVSFTIKAKVHEKNNNKNHWLQLKSRLHRQLEW